MPMGHKTQLDGTRLGQCSGMPPRTAYIGCRLVERFFNLLNLIGGIRAAVLFAVIAVAAIVAGGWQGWLIGSVFLGLVVYAVVSPWKWPKYRPPED